MSLKLKLVLSLCLPLAGYCAMLFVPAGSLRFWQGWALLAVIYIPGTAAFLYFYLRDPQLVQRRLERKEQIGEQKLLMRWTKPGFLIAFLIPGFDYRFRWSGTYLREVPLWLVLLSLAMVLIGLLLAIWVMNVNRFASSIIQVEAGQKVISSGPYRLVRHPMYLGGMMLWLFTPLALGSYVALPAFVVLCSFYVFRLLNEEEVLREQLPGYSEYCLRTPFRLIPYVW